MATLQRVHGSPAAGAFYGYQPLFLKITGTGVATADTVDATGKITATGTFSKALTALQQVGSIVFIGPRADDGFVVAVDAATASDNNEASVAARVDTVVTAATSVATTVAVVTLTAAGVTA